MNYKKILKNRDVRIKILNFLSFVPDQIMVKIQYYVKTGRKLNLKNPQRYTEKLQKYKLEYRNDLMRKCVDKYSVREYVRNRGYGNILNDLYAVYNDIGDVDLDELPDQFVIKDTTGAGSNSVMVINKKNDDYDERLILETIRRWLAIKPTKSVSREWPYDYIKHRVIVEKVLRQKNGDLDDYKFFCFNGKCKCFYKRSGYANDHDGGKMSFYDCNGKWLAGVGLDYCRKSNTALELCKNIKDMIKIAEDLSKEFPHVRVDLYNVDGKVVFGELTFFNAGGYMTFTPDEFDFELGKEFEI